MPWQRLVLDVGLEVDPETGHFAYREVVFTTPRQSGKTSIILPVEVDVCLMREDRQRVIYTAQSGTDARDKLLEDQVPILEASPLAKTVRKVTRAKGEEGVTFRNGSRISLAASSKQSGHGSTLDLGVLDEAWADEDNRREQAAVPAMNTRPDAQLWLCSTQGTAASVYLNRKTELGRAAAAADRGTGVAYFEWSIPLEADIEDPRVWWEFMPALGWTIGEPVIAHALENMDEAEWRRAYGNQPTKTERERIIPAALWDAVQDDEAEVDRGHTMFAVDVLPDRDFTAIVASDGRTLELVEHRPGTGWVVERLGRLVESWGGQVVIDGGGPAASLGDDLEAAGLKVKRLSSAEVAAACARIFDAIADARVAVVPAEPLDIAVSGLARKPVGDRFVWSRSASVTDATPFVAATLAFGTEPEKPRELFVAFT